VDWQTKLRLSPPPKGDDMHAETGESGVHLSIGGVAAIFSQNLTSHRNARLAVARRTLLEISTHPSTRANAAGLNSPEAWTAVSAQHGRSTGSLGRSCLSLSASRGG
jgi:hypothetical protein